MTKKAAEDDGGSNLMDQGSVQPAVSFGEHLIGPVDIEGRGGAYFQRHFFQPQRILGNVLARPGRGTMIEVDRSGSGNRIGVRCFAGELRTE